MSEEIEAFVQQFVANYTNEVIEEDVVSFFNDGFVMINHFNELETSVNEVSPFYDIFINHFISKKQYFTDFSTFDFSLINTYEKLKSNNLSDLKPVFTTYSFEETEEAINQIFEELKTVKEFRNELKDEISYLLEEYIFHLDHLEENMQYDFYVYNELLESKNINEDIELLREEKKKFLQKCNDKLNKK